MAIEKTNRINALFEFYEPLLTEKQMTYIELYYRDDYSLGEIAENYQVSRQAVYDNIKRTKRFWKNMRINYTCMPTSKKKSPKQIGYLPMLVKIIPKTSS